MTDTPKETLTHLNEDGDPTMVDVTKKNATDRVAIAEGTLRCSPEAFRLLGSAQNPKGNVEQVSVLAGIMAGKKTSDLIPLCHALPGASIDVQARIDPELPGLRVTAEARFQGKTGVEMEALTAVSVALLTAYDMLKAADKSMEIGTIRLLEKRGGKSGDWKAVP